MNNSGNRTTNGKKGIRSETVFTAQRQEEGNETKNDTDKSAERAARNQARAAAATARLDARILEKQRSESSSLSQSSSSFTQQQQQLQQQSKENVPNQSQKSRVAMTTTAANLPGAVAMEAGRIALASLESDVLTKATTTRETPALAPGLNQTRSGGDNKRRESGSIGRLSEDLQSDVQPGAVAVHPRRDLSRLEADVLEKALSATSAGGEVPTSPSQSTETELARSERRLRLAQLEASVLGKALSSTSVTRTATTNSNQPTVSVPATGVASSESVASVASAPSSPRRNLFEMEQNVLEKSYNARSVTSTTTSMVQVPAASGLRQQSSSLREEDDKSITEDVELQVSGAAEDEDDKKDEDLESDMDSRASELNGGLPGHGVNQDEADLVEAVIVPAEENAAYIPSAVQFDPDAKPARYKGRRRRVLAFGALVLLVVVGVSVWVLVVFNNKKSTSDGASRATSDGGIRIRVSSRGTLGIDQLVSSVLDDTPEQQEKVFNQTDSPYAKALHWITYRDPSAMLPSDPQFVQRYLAAYLYYATTVEQPWSSCNPPEPDALDGFCMFKNLIETEPIQIVDVPAVRWLSEYEVCDWAGIKCDSSDQIVKIDLGGANMTGPFPEGVRYLPFLQTLDLAYGHMTGPIPGDAIASMKNLVFLDLSLHDFSGSLPESLPQARSLQYLDMHYNRLTGSIPSEIGVMHDAKWIVLEVNGLEGRLPETMGNMRSVANIYLGQNRITGSIPSFIGNLTMLHHLHLDRNLLTGTIPSELNRTNNPRFIRIKLQGNKLSGSVPDSFWETGISEIDLRGCNLTGTISSQIVNATGEAGLSKLLLDDNRFYGAIPSELGSSQSLIELGLSRNDFNGTMPQEICNTRGDFNLRSLEADCLPDPQTGLAEVECSSGCCTRCCNAEGRDCENV